MKNLYVAYDKVASSTLCCFMSSNDGMAIRENVVALSKVLPLGDIELRCVGTIDEVSSVVFPTDYRIVDWDSYKFPESPMKPISKTDVQKSESEVTR